MVVLLTAALMLTTMTQNPAARDVVVGIWNL